jgi:hypothetical protein
MGNIGPFPGWLAAAGLVAGIDWWIMQFDPQGAYIFAYVILASVLILRPGAIAGITSTLAHLIGSAGSSGAPQTADNGGAPADTGAPVRAVS